MSFDALFAGHRVMVILRGLPPSETVRLATAAWDAAVPLVEVPLGQDRDTASLAAVVAAGRERGMGVGAGTVVSESHVDAAAAAGAVYTVAPGLDAEVLRASRDAGLPHLPGVATPSEVQRALALGCDWVKVFPAAALGPGWLRAMRGPFPGLRTVATGGLTLATAPDFLAAGASVVALGSALSDAEAVAGLTRLVGDTAARD